MRTVAEMFAEMKKIADEEGFQFNPVKEELDDILQGLWNDHRYGYLSCSCRLASGLMADDYPSIMEQKGAGGKEMAQVYRCNVCGYLCAREEPPDFCPICRAKKERFEESEMKG